MDSLKSRLERQKEALLEKDRLYEEIQLRLSSESETGALQKSECNTLRKQVRQHNIFAIMNASIDNMICGASRVWFSQIVCYYAMVKMIGILFSL